MTKKTQEAGAVRSALVGAFFAADATGHCLALATICFGGALSAGLGLATGLFLFASAISTFFLFRFGRLPIAFGIAQDTTISILAPVLILAATSVSGPALAQVATAFAILGTSAVLTGIAFWSVGRLGLGRMVRMFPFPVAAGFLASSGYLLVFAGFSILTHETDIFTVGQALLDPLVQLRLVPAMVMAVLLLLGIRFIGGTMPVLVTIFVFLIGFYVLCFGMGVSIERLIEIGMLPKVDIPAGQELSFGMISLIDWSVVVSVFPVLLAIVFLNLLGMLLNISGVELATRGDIDENHELRMAGLANVVIGVTGGLTAFLQGGASIILAKMGVQPRAAISGYLLALIVATFAAPLIVTIVPVFIPAALVMFIGMSMMQDWLLATRARLTVQDWLIVLAIVAATIVVGIMPAIAIGFALAVFGFAYAAIRLPVIRHSTTVQERRSIRDRNAVDGETLQLEGHKVRILHLQGALFFGSVEQMIQHLRGVIARDPQVVAAILDFSEVRSFDSSACAALEKLFYLLDTKGITPHLTGVAPSLKEIFLKWGLPVADLATADRKTVRVWPTLDEAIEHCEDVLLAVPDQTEDRSDIKSIFAVLGRNHPRLDDLFAAMEVQSHPKGTVVIRAKDRSADTFIVKTGRLGVLLPMAGGKTVRVRAMGPGAIVGEVAYLTGLPRSADVVCEEDSTLYCLSKQTMRRIDEEDRDLAALIMLIFSRSLAAKLDLTNGFLTYAQNTRGSGSSD